ncbi:MAG TPA: N-acetylmuramoyl-L-alanine amidase [Candidatus Acidoferrales bacterium]|nr:N-acetylmuramoyl-L-alanine amidase [Candidatus Acidoferrales bacterium]
MTQRGRIAAEKIPARLVVVCAAALIFLCPLFSAPAAGAQSLHAQAKTQYNKAQQMRQSLEAKPQDNRTLAEYKKVVAAYRRVYLLTSSAPETTLALQAVAQLYRDMGDDFDQEYYQSSIVTYKFLISQYPTSKLRSDALFQIGKIQKDDLGDTAEAKDAFKQYLQRFPHAEQSDDARDELKELASMPAKPATDSASAAGLTRASQERRIVGDAPPAATSSGTSSGPSPRVASGAAETTSDANDNGDAESSEAAETPKKGEPSSVTAIRTWNADDYTRVVVDLNGAVKYQAARIKNPDRIYFDLYQAHLGHSLTDKELAVPNGFLKSVRVAQNKSGIVRLVLDVRSIEGYSAFLLPNPYRLVIDVHGTAQTISAKNSAPAVVAPGRLAGDRPTVSAGPSLAATEKVEVSSAAGAGTLEEGESSGKPNSANADSAHASHAGRNNRTLPAGPLLADKPTRDGARSLTRTLGLKINRIVIDPGHGGHDTGTIGPHGVLEKNICLDVALRLGNLIQQKLPGAEVVYTRKTDVFIPLEERTAIANQAGADLFLSIHANSSHDEGARGIETYYLNFTSSPEALETASRENAVSNASIHELQDLIKKIARNDKIEESQELATDIQSSLTTQLRQISTAERNRGVKKAPFVVLIGADMPSVLAEISFLSNPTDERMLRKGAQRQRIAQGLFRGVENYLSSLNSLNYDRRKPTLVSDRQTPAAAAGSREQR